MWIGTNYVPDFASANFSQFAIWDIALSQEQVDLYIGNHPSIQTEGLVGYWKFNAGEDTTLYDHSGNQNHGTIYGAEWVLQRDNILISIDSVSAFQNDTVLVGVNVVFPADSTFSSAELSFAGFQGSLDFLEVDTANSLIGDADWIIEINETDTLLITVSAGSNDISGEGTLLWLKFAVPDTSDFGFVPVTVEYALFDETDLEIETVNGGVEVLEPELVAFYGDVSLNGEVHAYDASLILKYLVETEALDDQQMLNANVSLDTTVSALDASLILKYVAVLIDTLPYDTSMGSLLATGDIDMQDGTFEPGGFVEVPLYLTNGDNILSFETEIGFDAEALTYSSATWSNDLDGFTIELNMLDGELLFAGAGSSPDGQENIFATLRFMVNESFNGDETTVLMSRLRFNEGEVIENGASSTLTNVLSIDDELLPLSFKLHHNHPNPFNPITSLRYDLPVQAQVTLTIYDLTGREVTQLVNTTQEPGFKSVRWNATDMHGKPVSAGVYLYQIRAGEFVQTKKMVLLK
jgi:hypothetical protein